MDLTESDRRDTEAFLGDVSHNLGTAYANLFLFSQAADCYKTAYEKNTNPSSKKSELFCLFLADKKMKNKANGRKNTGSVQNNSKSMKEN